MPIIRWLMLGVVIFSDGFESGWVGSPCVPIPIGYHAPSDDSILQITQADFTCGKTLVYTTSPFRSLVDITPVGGLTPGVEISIVNYSGGGIVHVLGPVSGDEIVILDEQYDRVTAFSIGHEWLRND